MSASLPESRFTAATPACPDPGRWHSPDTDATEDEVTELVAAFVRATQPEVVVETGTYLGHTTEAIGQALARNGHGVCHSFEVDADRQAAAQRRCVGLPVRCWLRPSLSAWGGEPIDFAWFDSLIDLRVPEFYHYRPFLVPGAVVGFHDTADHHGLWPGIEGLADDGLVSPIRLATPRGVTFCQLR